MEQHKQPDITSLWPHQSHELGFCYRHPEQQIQFVIIPKCASSWIKEIIRLLHWKPHNFVDEDTYDWTTLAVVRDPWDRWCSGVGEWLHRRFNTHHVHIQSFVDHMEQYNRKFEMHNTGHLREHEWHWIEKLIALGSPHDEHTEMQSAYLANCTKIQAFNFGKTLSQDVNRHFNTQYNIPPKLVRARHQIKDVVYRYLQDRKKVLLPHIKKVYKSDFDLYNTLMGTNK